MLRTMADKEIFLAIIGTDVSAAGLLLVFAGFVIAKAESFQNVTRADRYRWLARGSLIPIILALASAWLSVDALQGCQWCADQSLPSLKFVLVFTGLYAVISALLTF